MDGNRIRQSVDPPRHWESSILWILVRRRNTTKKVFHIIQVAFCARCNDAIHISYQYQFQCAPRQRFGLRTKSLGHSGYKHSCALRIFFVLCAIFISLCLLRASLFLSLFPMAVPGSIPPHDIKTDKNRRPHISYSQKFTVIARAAMATTTTSTHELSLSNQSKFAYGLLRTELKMPRIMLHISHKHVGFNKINTDGLYMLHFAFERHIFIIEKNSLAFLLLLLLLLSACFSCVAVVSSEWTESAVHVNSKEKKTYGQCYRSFRRR